MKRVWVLVFVGISTLNLMFSQDSTYTDKIRSVSQSTLIGIGKSYLFDSYLSPLTYDGIAISLIHDRLKGSDLFNGTLLLQNQYRLQTGVTKNPTSSASEYWGSLYYNLNGYLPILNYNINSRKLRIYGGGGP